MTGFATCYEAKTGKEKWRERLVGQFSSSPIATDRLAYFQNEAGETVVIEPGPELNIVARNVLDAASDEIFRASLTPHGGKIYSRSNRFLYCIGEAKAAGD
jgi:outer membrane protein assembly factor BamB